MNVFDLSAKIAMDINGYLKSMDTAKAVAISTLSVIGGAVGDFMNSSIDAGLSFDKSISQVAATMGLNMTEMAEQTGSVNTQFGQFNGTLRDFAQFMGRNTAFTATQASDALNYMALAGYDVQTSMEMLPNVLNLAAAGGFDLARASDMITDTQTAFGISLGRTNRMVDEMAKAASTGNTSVEQLGDAFLVVGGLAADLNGGMVTLADGTTAETDGVQELEIALTAMANAGVKGSEAGTHMRNMLLKLSSPTEQGADAMEELGVKVFDADGKMRSLRDIFGEMNTAMGNLTQQEKLQRIADIFNARDISSAEALLSAVSADWDHIGESILDASGAAAKMADTQLDNLAGDMTLFESALEGAKIAISDSLTPVMRDMTQIGTTLIQSLTEGFRSLPEPVQTVIGMIGMIGSKALEMAPQVMSLVDSLNLAKIASGNADGKGFMSGLSGMKTTIGGIGASIGAIVALSAIGLENTRKLIEANTVESRAFKTEMEGVNADIQNVVKWNDDFAELGYNTDDWSTTLIEAKENLASLKSGERTAKKATEDLTTAQGLLMRALDDSDIDWKNLFGQDYKTTSVFSVYQEDIKKLKSEINSGAITSVDQLLERLNQYRQLGAHGQNQYIEVLIQRINDYSDGAAEAADAAQAIRDEWTRTNNVVELATIMNKEMTDSERAKTEEVLRGIDVQGTNIEVYQAATGAISAVIDEHQKYTSELQTQQEYIKSTMESAKAEYYSAYQSISGNLDGLFGKFNAVPEIVASTTTEILEGSNQVIATSMDTLLGGLDSQYEFMQTYQTNLAAVLAVAEASGVTLNQNLVNTMSDGTMESAQMLAGIVEDFAGGSEELLAILNSGEEDAVQTFVDIVTQGDTRIGELNEKFGKVEEGKKTFARHTANMQTDFTETMKRLGDSWDETVQRMDMYDKAFNASMNNVRGIVAAANAGIPEVGGAYSRLAEIAINTFKARTQQASPSKAFARMSRNNVLGIINEASRMEGDVYDAYQTLATATMEGYNDALDEFADVPSVGGSYDYGTTYEVVREDTPQEAAPIEITMNIYGEQGQDVTALADQVITRIKRQLNRDVRYA